MKIFGMCAVKNEEDIIEEVLTKASKWCDYIFVYDTGSDDSTWQKIQDLSKNNSAIIPFKYAKVPFRDELRGEIFNKYRHLAQDGDWWCRLDSDEIYIDDPKVFLKKVSKYHHVVWSASCQYYFTNKDVETYNKDPQCFLSLPAEDRIKYYICNHSEARFFKHRTRLKWHNGSFPVNLGIVSPFRIRLKHLQYRSPQQIQKRLETRKQAIKEGYKVFEAYSSETSWTEKVVDSNDYNYDDNSGNYIVDEKMLPSFPDSMLKLLTKYVLHKLKIFP